MDFDDLFSKNNIKNSKMGTMTAWNLIIEKSFLDKYNIRFDTSKIFEDQLFVGKIYIHSEKITIINCCLYNYRIRNSSTSFTEPNGYQDLIRISKELFIELSQSENCKKLMGIFLSARIRRIFYWFDRYSMLFDESIAEGFYNEIRSFFVYLKDKVEIQNYRTIIGKKNYRRFIKILKNSYIQYSINKDIKRFIKNIFSVRNIYNDDIKHKVITILGIKVKFKRKNNAKG